MKIAIAIRTCDSVLSYWNSTRMIACSKTQITLTCLRSLLKAIAYNDKFGQDEVVFSIHDDNSSPDTQIRMGKEAERFGVEGQLCNSGTLNNFKTQYEWCKVQDCDYIYCVEDDYLHKPDALHEMRTVVEDMAGFLPGDYAVHPFNNPHRYASFEMLYPSYILKGRNGYWRSCFHSTHTFFISRKAFDLYDGIMRKQAYEFPHCTEDNSINQVWREQKVRLLTPLDSLAFHLADKSQEDPFYDWYGLWQGVWE